MKISVFEGKRKENEAVKCEEKERCPVEFIEALARVLDRSMLQAAKEKGITEVVFDRGGFIYQGKVKALAEAAREAGLEF